jgi:SAM-dependent methyltransferase
MAKGKKADSKEVGLEIGLIIFKYFFHEEHLHYGYWTKDLPVDLAHLPQAQENYYSFLISQIPEGVKTILDIGCGAGRLAFKLIDLGYKVDAVSPSATLTKHTRKLLKDKSQIFECTFEELQTENHYDLILFSESFQYVNLEKALKNSLKFLNEGGHILISDFFKIEITGDSPIGGGHRLIKFYDLISQYPFKKVKELDITRETAPTLNLANDLLSNLGLPIWNLIIDYLNSKHPYLSKFLQWKYRNKIARINRIYFSGTLNAESFANYKSYRLLLYKKIKT